MKLLALIFQDILERTKEDGNATIFAHGSVYANFEKVSTSVRYTVVGEEIEVCEKPLDSGYLWSNPVYL